ncbi:6-phospho-beta-glucosidase gmuD [Raoultella terrigena]|uniref:6-phospho-beta-glucosidase gmuD n=1 Tax=Raoultella terrigena TaxID=577 RepID=A0A4U9CZG7_RAOTE|nr:6-phospho-beta-glucosidase gmuD [Raoultella terrigena]
MRAAEVYDLFYNRIFLDPLVHGEYPPALFALLAQHDVAWDYSAEELAIIRDNTVDELGINLYYPHRVKAPSRAWHPQTPFHPAWYYEPFELPGRRMNASRGWEIYPRIVFDMAMRIKNDYRNIPWFIAESGMGVENEGQVSQRRRHHCRRVPHSLYQRASLADAARAGGGSQLSRLHAVGVYRQRVADERL